MWKFESVAIISSSFTNLSKMLSNIRLWTVLMTSGIRCFFTKVLGVAWMSYFMVMLSLSQQLKLILRFCPRNALDWPKLFRREEHMPSLFSVSLGFWDWEVEYWYQAVYPSVKLSLSISLIIFNRWKCYGPNSIHIA